MEWLTMLVGGAGIGSIVTAVLTRLSTKESNKANNNVLLWDRTYKLIESLEKQVAILKQQLADEEAENEELRGTIRELESQVRTLKWELEEAKKKGSK